MSCIKMWWSQAKMCVTFFCCRWSCCFSLKEKTKSGFLLFYIILFDRDSLFLFSLSSGVCVCMCAWINYIGAIGVLMRWGNHFNHQPINPNSKTFEFSSRNDVFSMLIVTENNKRWHLELDYVFVCVCVFLKFLFWFFLRLLVESNSFGGADEPKKQKRRRNGAKRP